jgi:hypothetical protein
MPTAREIVKAVVTALIVTAILALGSWALSKLDADVALWVVALIAFASLLVGFLIGKRTRVASLLPSYHAEHIEDTILTLQHVQAGKLIGISLEELIERGILGPARYGLTFPGSDVRLSVLVPSSSTPGEFEMAYEAGHTVGRKVDFRLTIAGSFASHALDSRELVWTNNVEKDPRWRRHPKAREGRDYGALAATPIEVGDDVIGVLSVLSARCRSKIAWAVSDSALITSRRSSMRSSSDDTRRRSSWASSGSS